ncbi:MAG: hypothetical protein JNL39_16480, partial [Opitutaceae bacterium]|nr:hypothetical protein [Opitutaceae bacterium]
MFRVVVAFVLSCAAGVRVTAQDPWQLQASGTNSTLRGVAHGLGEFVAVGDGGTILTSPDGVVWTKRQSGTVKSLRAVVWGSDSYIAVGDGGTVLQSPDGVTWFLVSVQNAAADWRINAVSFWRRSGGFGDMFFAVGEDGLVVYRTSSGVWTGKKEPAARWPLRGVLAEGDHTYVIGQQGLFRIGSVLYYLDGGVRESLRTGELEAITQGADRTVAVGRSGSVWIKNTGFFAWSQVVNAASGDLFGVTFFDGVYVAVGASGALWSARDPGGRWSLLPAVTTENLHAVAASANTAVAVGERGTVLRVGLPANGAPVVLEPPAAASSSVDGVAGFAVKAGGAPPLRYEWLRDGQIIADATSRVLVIPVLVGTDAGRYSVRVTNGIGSVTSPAAQLNVGPAPTVPIVDARFRADPRLDVEPPAGSNQSREATTGILPLPDGRVLVGLSG